jgi:hypothetical protein
MTQYHSLVHEYLFKTFGVPLSTASLATYILLDIYKRFTFDTSDVWHIAARLQSVFYLYGWEGLLEEEKRIIDEIKIN